MLIRSYQPDNDADRWDRYVQMNPDASFFHLSGWESVLRGFFGHQTHYLLAEQDGRVVGVMPLARVRSPLFGDSLVSTPLCVYGGAVADSPEIGLALTARAAECARELNVDQLELRHVHRQGDYPSVDRYVRFRKPIQADPDENMKEIPRKQRAMIRKAGRRGLQADFDSDTAVFYRLYAESLRNLGTPVLPRQYFKYLKSTFGNACEQLTIRSDDGRPVAGVLSFYFRDEVLPYYGGGSSEARSLSANDFMYWELMCHAAARGCRMFDFGRSRVGVGSYHFKRHWGFEPEPLSYQYCLVRARELPNPSPDNARYRFLINCWKRLPLPVTMWIGPLVSRKLAW